MRCHPPPPPASGCIGPFSSGLLDWRFPGPSLSGLARLNLRKNVSRIMMFANVFSICVCLYSVKLERIGRSHWVQCPHSLEDPLRMFARNAIQCNIQCNIYCNIVQYILQYSTCNIYYNILQYIVQHGAVYCNIVQYSAAYCQCNAIFKLVM